MNGQNDLKRAIDAIVATDKKAREATDMVRRNAADSDRVIARRVKAVRDQYMSRALQRVDIIQKVETEYADYEWEQAQKRYKALSDALDARYAEMGDKWVEELVSNVINAD